MKIEHQRVYNRNSNGRAYSISHVYIDGVYSHDTIEDYDRGLDQSMTAAQVARIKVKSKTAIPTGTYTVNLNRVSPKFSTSYFYKNICKGKVPCLDPVVGFSGILIHCGINENSSAGCVIVGKNKIVGQVNDSQNTFIAFYKKMIAAANKGEKITYIITRKYTI